MLNMEAEKHHKSKRKILILSAFLSLLVVAAVSITLVHRHNKNQYAVMRSACAATLYPDFCLSTLIVPRGTVVDMFVAGIDKGITTVGKFFEKLETEKLQRLETLTSRQKFAFIECIAFASSMVGRLKFISKELENGGSKKDYIIEHKDNTSNFLSNVYTGVVTCFDGFSHSPVDRNLRKVIQKEQMAVKEVISEVMALLNQSVVAEGLPPLKPLPEERGLEEEWPEWLLDGDRLLLQSSTVKEDVTVAADGSGNYTTVAAAVAEAPEGRSVSRRYVIRIKAGIYRESVEISINKTNLMFVGDGRMNTIITASRSVVDGTTTYGSATVGKLSFHTR